MAVSAKEAGYLAAQAKRSNQNRKTPFLINAVDGRLVPNILTRDEKTGEQFSRIMRHNSNYRPFHGDPKASREERLAYVDSNLGAVRSAAGSALGDLAGEPAFDIGRASKDELVTFAADEYGAVLSAATDIRTLRKQVADLAAG
jgi:hypothetical protein